MAWHSDYGRYGPLDVSPSRVKKWLTCPKQFEYQYVRRVKSSTGLAAMQGTALHDVFLEEMLRGGCQDVAALVDLTEITFRDALEHETPCDYNTGEPVDMFAKEVAVDQLRIWAKGLFDAYINGEDSYGNKLVLPEVVATEVEKAPYEIHLPKTGVTLRIRGHIDFILETGGIGDLKLASDYYLGVWTLARALGEIQPAMYRMMVGSPGPFTYLIVDKKKGRTSAHSPVVRTIDFEVTPEDFDRTVELLEAFVHGTQVHNEYEGGYFPAVPDYNGETKKDAGKTEWNFCGKMCSFKKICYNENFKRPISIDSNAAAIVED